MTRGRVFVALGLWLLICGPTLTRARQGTPQNPPPRFVSGVDVVELDMSVLGKDRKPVRGLKAEDFTVREDGKVQKIVALSEVSVTPPAPPSAPWKRDVPPDVETNAPPDHNAFVIILDDALLRFTDPRTTTLGPVALPADPFMLKMMKDTARKVVEGLRDDDTAAVVFTNDNFNGATFTGNRARLLKAIDTTTFGPMVGCPQWLGSSQALRSTVEALATVQHRRKTVFLISLGTDYQIIGDPPNPERDCKTVAQGALHDAIQFAQASSVNVYTIDPAGLRVRDDEFSRLQIQSLQQAAENTGGRAIINTNDAPGQVAAILEEARAYYLIGYELSNRAGDGLFHRLEMQVNRPGAEVHFRKTRFDPLPESGAGKPVPPAESALGGFFPNGDLQLQVTSSVFAGPSGAGRVEIGLAGELPRGAAGRAPDDLQVLVRAFTPDGRPMGSADRTVAADLQPVAAGSAPAPDAPGASFAVSSEIALKPGRYSLRVAVHSAATGTTGSVYTEVTVPDFAKEPLSVSGALVTFSSVSSLRGDPLAAMQSMAVRAFAATDRPQVFVRVYQGDAEPLGDVTIRTRLVDDQNQALIDRRATLPAAAFARARQADYSYSLPVSSLKPGEYWLSIETTAGKRTVRRDIRFSVKP